MNSLVHIASENKMEIVSCTEELDLMKYNIHPGKCIDDEHIERCLELALSTKKILLKERHVVVWSAKILGGTTLVYLVANTVMPQTALNRQRLYTKAMIQIQHP